MSDNYKFARGSSIPNAGEDLLGSARHKRNAWRGLKDAEANGTAIALINRDNLLKNEPHSLISTLTSENALSHLTAHLAIAMFPSTPYTELGSYRYTSELELREQYFNAYTAIRDHAQDLAIAHTDPIEVMQAISRLIGRLIKVIRKTEDGEINQRYAKSDDPCNPVANELCEMYKRVNVRRYYRANDLGSKINDFVKRMVQSDKDILEIVTKILSGKNFNEAFETVGKKANSFNPAQLYVGNANRVGGRIIEYKDVESGLNNLINEVGLRGIQFGNSVTDSERIEHLQKISEALADLADMTSLPDRAISLDGVLGLAVGARGSGSNLAHYEPSNKVINLTRKSGAGSLAHEWGHALDNYLEGGRVDKKGTPYFLSDSCIRDKIDPVSLAMVNVRLAMEESGFNTRLRIALREAVKRGELSHKKAFEYWASTLEKFARVFERFIAVKLRKLERESGYLSGVELHPFWSTDAETEAMTPAIEALLLAVKDKHFRSLTVIEVVKETIKIEVPRTTVKEVNKVLQLSLL